MVGHAKDGARSVTDALRWVPLDLDRLNYDGVYWVRLPVELHLRAFVRTTGTGAYVGFFLPYTRYDINGAWRGATAAPHGGDMGLRGRGRTLAELVGASVLHPEDLHALESRLHYPCPGDAVGRSVHDLGAYYGGPPLAVRYNKGSHVDEVRVVWLIGESPPYPGVCKETPTAYLVYCESARALRTLKADGLTICPHTASERTSCRIATRTPITSADAMPQAAAPEAPRWAGAAAFRMAEASPGQPHVRPPPWGTGTLSPRIEEGVRLWARTVIAQDALRGTGAPHIEVPGLVEAVVARLPEDLREPQILAYLLDGARSRVVAILDEELAAIRRSILRDQLGVTEKD